MGPDVDNHRGLRVASRTAAGKDAALNPPRIISGYLFHWSYPAQSRQGERAGIGTFTDRDKLQAPCASALLMELTCQ